MNKKSTPNFHFLKIKCAVIFVDCVSKKVFSAFCYLLSISVTDIVLSSPFRLI